MLHCTKPLRREPRRLRLRLRLRLRREPRRLRYGFLGAWTVDGVFINEAAQTADEGTDMDVDSEGRGSRRRVLSAYAARSAGSADGTH